MAKVKLSLAQSIQILNLRSVQKICLLSLLFLTPCLCSCAIVAGTIDSFRRVGLTAKSREGLFTPALTKFNEVLGWGDITLALTLVTDSYRTELRDQLMRDKDKVKVIESNIDLVEFGDDSYTAEVFMSVKAYTVPFYIAETTKKKQTWVFSLSDGWKISKSEPFNN